MEFCYQRCKFNLWFLEVDLMNSSHVLRVGKSISIENVDRSTSVNHKLEIDIVYFNLDLR